MRDGDPRRSLTDARLVPSAASAIDAESRLNASGEPLEHSPTATDDRRSRAQPERFASGLDLVVDAIAGRASR
jgi:hypothetical protein